MLHRHERGWLSMITDKTGWGQGFFLVLIALGENGMITALFSNLKRNLSFHWCFFFLPKRCASTLNDFFCL
jgi:hypothetical protein